MSNVMVRTTLTLPADLLEATDNVVRQGKVRSRNAFVADALRRELAARRRAEIDADFAEMGNDPDVCEESIQLEREFAQASWEAFQLGEAEYQQSDRWEIERADKAKRGPGDVEAEA